MNSVSIALFRILGLLALMSPEITTGSRAEAPSGVEVDGAVSRGIEYLKRRQESDGSWGHTFMHDHRLGMTALAGLALIENGIKAEDPTIARALQIVASLASRSDQTYDLSLAILFLVREGSRGRDVEGDLIARLGARLAGGSHNGIWTYTVPGEGGSSRLSGRRGEVGSRRRRRDEIPAVPRFNGIGDNSNTQFALLGLWAAGRREFDGDEALETIDRHFRSTQLGDGRWGYQPGREGAESMSCAGLMGLAITAARPGLAERQTARARGTALASDSAFQRALRAVASDAGRIGPHSDIYYLWSLERVCVALGLRSLDGLDWYARGARVLLDRQQRDGSWPHDRWGVLPNTSLALLFLRKANLAFELDRVLKLPTVPVVAALVRHEIQEAQEDAAPVDDSSAAQEQVDQNHSVPRRQDDGVPSAKNGADEDGEATVTVTGASQQAFPQIEVQFELKKPDGSFILDARREDFRVAEEGKDVEIRDFRAPISTEAIPTTLVLVVDRSLSMEEEDRIGSLKGAVASFLGRMPTESRVAVVAFGSEVSTICPFTTDRERVKSAVDRLRPGGATRFHDGVSEALEMLDREHGRRAILALTDGEDTFSQSATLDSTIAAARRLGLPVYTLGLGTEDEIESGDLKRLAGETRGQYYPARRADQLRAIYESIATRIGASYTLAYQSDRRLPDGTLRPVQVRFRGSRQAGETSVFIPGMVAPAGGWSPLFLLMSCLLGALAISIPRWYGRTLDGRKSGS